MYIYHALINALSAQTLNQTWFNQTTLSRDHCNIESDMYETVYCNIESDMYEIV